MEVVSGVSRLVQREAGVGETKWQDWNGRVFSPEMHISARKQRKNQKLRKQCHFKLGYLLYRTKHNMFLIFLMAAIQPPHLQLWECGAEAGPCSPGKWHSWSRLSLKPPILTSQTCTRCNKHSINRWGWLHPFHSPGISLVRCTLPCGPLLPPAKFTCPE